MADSLKVALAQLNPKVGDVSGNLAKVRAAREEAKKQGAELVLTSELVLSGYPPEDLVLTVSRPGSVGVGEKTYDLNGLTALLREARGRYANQGVLIRGDAALSYQALADVLSACDEAGIRNVRLPVRSRDERAAAAPSSAKSP